MATDNTSKRPTGDATGGATVVVASKMPFDFTLQLHEWFEEHEPVLGGGTRKVRRARKAYDRPTFVVNGNSHSQNKGPSCQIVGGDFGYAITHGIPKAFWEEWLDQNKEATYIKNGIIFAHAEAASTISEATEKQKVVSNHERMDPENLAKWSKSNTHYRRPA